MGDRMLGMEKVWLILAGASEEQLRLFEEMRAFRARLVLWLLWDDLVERGSDVY
jgi:hypothetical protein